MRILSESKDSAAQAGYLSAAHQYQPLLAGASYSRLGGSASTVKMNAFNLNDRRAARCNHQDAFTWHEEQPLLAFARHPRARGGIDEADSSVMALRHKEFDVRGVQFHPESVLTEHGKQLMQNWLGQ